MAVAVVTGAGAGVGRATAREFARLGYDVGLIGRDPGRLQEASREVEAFGGRACVAVADVGDADALEAAAETIEKTLGPIEAWVNNAAATMFAPLMRTELAEFRRGTEVTYFGTVYGTLVALRRMRLRDRGIVINVGSVLADRALPLQTVSSGAKAAVRGFTDALRSELLHDGSRIRIAMVHLPAINTPQFDWALNKMGVRPQPAGPVYQPEVAARAIVFVAEHPRREVWVGLSTLAIVLANRLVPSLADRYLAHFGYGGQLTDQRAQPHAPDNLDHPVPGAFAAHGRFDARARDTTRTMITSRHRDAIVAIGAVALLAGLHRMARRLRRR